MSDDEVEVDKMRLALSAIANEMQRLQNDSLNSDQTEACEGEDVLNNLIQCKYTLKCKKEEIKQLKQNLKTVCFVAKTVSSAKENETTLLNDHLNFARNQYLDLVQQSNEETDRINKLTIENQSLRDKLEYFDHFIELGYRELQKVRKEPVDDVPTLQQLKKIILCCGQYYADYSNEHDKCVRFEQKIRFLSNKIRILECNTTSQKYIKTHKNEIKHKGTSFRRSESRKPRETIGVVCSEYQMSKRHSKFSNVTMTKIELNKHVTRDLNLTSHLDMVKKLLHDQDKLLKELKDLSKEIINLDP